MKRLIIKALIRYIKNIHQKQRVARNRSPFLCSTFDERTNNWLKLHGSLFVFYTFVVLKRSSFLPLKQR